MQKRAKTGIDFEHDVQIDGWIKKTKSPKLKWCGEGRSILDKLKSINYDSKLFTLDNTSIYSKYDVYNPTTNSYCEVKKYEKEKLNDWVLYSEPYFKIASKNVAKKISNDVYNKFTEEFFILHQESGFFEKVIENMIENTDGVIMVNGFIPKNELEFRTVLLKHNWGGYHRITIQFRLKKNE